MLQVLVASGGVFVQWLYSAVVRVPFFVEWSDLCWMIDKIICLLARVAKKTLFPQSPSSSNESLKRQTRWKKQRQRQFLLCFTNQFLTQPEQQQRVIAPGSPLELWCRGKKSNMKYLLQKVLRCASISFTDHCDGLTDVNVFLQNG